MNKNQKIFLITISLALIIIIAIIYFIFLKKAPILQEPPIEDGPSLSFPESEDKELNPSDRYRNHQEYDISKEQAHQIDAIDLSKISSSFAESLGSYSNYSNYTNYEDLNLFMTKQMREWAKTYVKDMREKMVYDGTYYGIITKAISTEVLSFDDKKGQAEILVITKRKELGASGGELNYEQTLRLIFKKERNEWLIDAAYWLD